MIEAETVFNSMERSKSMASSKSMEGSKPMANSNSTESSNSIASSDSVAASSSSVLAMAPQTLRFYRNVLLLLNQADIPYLVGGTYALNHYTGLDRYTKDFDIFIARSDFYRIADAVARAGYRTELTYPHWLGKTFCDNDFVDLVFNSGNGVAEVDSAWFDHAPTAETFGITTKICPAEEMIWSKAFIMERERFDGADVAHLILACGDKMDWQRLMHRFTPHWQLLLSHLVLFGMIYPAHKDLIPEWVMGKLLEELDRDLDGSVPAEDICGGTLLSREQYLTDIQNLGRKDARLSPYGTLSANDADRWTAAIQQPKS